MAESFRPTNRELGCASFITVAGAESMRLQILETELTITPFAEGSAHEDYRS